MIFFFHFSRVNLWKPMKTYVYTTHNTQYRFLQFFFRLFCAGYRCQFFGFGVAPKRYLELLRENLALYKTASPCRSWASKSPIFGLILPRVKLGHIKTKNACAPFLGLPGARCGGYSVKRVFPCHRLQFRSAAPVREHWKNQTFLFAFQLPRNG